MDLFGSKERRAHRERLIKAAGVSTVPLVCNDDTWTFIHQQCTTGLSPVNFAKDSAKRREDGLVEIPFSGPKLVKLLTQVRITANAVLTSHPSWAVAMRVNDAVGEVIDQVDFTKPDGERPPPIIIDARLTPQ